MTSLQQLRRLAENVLLGERVVFHHLPKCGGTSIRKALRNSYPFSYAAYGSDPVYRAFEALHPDHTLDQLAIAVTEFREAQLLYFLHRDIKCVSGLCRFSNTAYRLFGQRHKFITTLREPISLMTSIYNYDRYMSRDRWRTELSIEAYLDTPRAARFGAIYSEFYNGLPATSDPTAEVAIASAKRNLLKFSVVGFVEDMPGFQRRLRSELNNRIRIGHHNVARVNAGERFKSLTSHLRQQITDLSRVNLEIYDYAVANTDR